MNGTMKAKILVVDDEADLLAELAPLLERSGYSVTTAADGKQSLILIAQTKPDLVVLDVMMPRMDGREVLRQLRQSGDWTPVILLTRVGSPTERAMSLQEGADDYLNKPFEPLELIARIQAVLRRVDRGSQPLTAFRKLVSGELVIDRQTRQSRLGDRALNLSARAFAVLEFLALHSREVVTRDRLLDQVWGWSEPVGTRTVDTRINELRRALEDDADNPTYIETVIGSGYRFLRRVEGAE
jgi:DNA-binding response OmpR family regulator